MTESRSQYERSLDPSARDTATRAGPGNCDQPRPAVCTGAGATEARHDDGSARNPIASASASHTVPAASVSTASRWYAWIFAVPTTPSNP